MESTHVISITNGEDNIISHINKEEKTHQFACLVDKMQMKNDHEIKKMIHSIKVGISLVLVSLLYILNPLFEQVGENAMWAIMTVVVIFEFSAGATLGKGFNRGIGTIVGGGLGCLAAVFAQSFGGLGNSIIVATLVYIFGSVATYFRLDPRMKNKYDYGVVVFMLTFNLIVVSGARPGFKVWEIARERLFTILMGFFVCISVSLFVFPLWASDELHHSIVSRFHDLANTIQGCLEEGSKSMNEEDQPDANFTLCKSILNSKSKDESLANFAKWEPWHGKFGFSHPWEKYLKIGEVLRDLAAFILAVGHCLQASKQSMASLKKSTKSVQLKQCEAIGSKLVWTLKEVGDSMKEMRKYETGSNNISAKLKAVREELNVIISTTMKSKLENGEMLAIASFVFLLMEVVEKVEELVKEVVELGDIAAFRTPLSS